VLLRARFADDAAAAADPGRTIIIGADLALHDVTIVCVCRAFITRAMVCVQ
jgi:hypothetical protein